MKIIHRVILGYAVFIILLGALLAYQVFAIRAMQAVNQRNTGANFRMSLAALLLMRDQDSVSQYARKYFATGDPSLLARLKAAQESCESRIRDISYRTRSEKEQTEIARLTRFWRESAEVRDKLKPGASSAFPEDLESHLERLRIQSYSFYNATLQTISSEAERSQKESERAGFVLWSTAAMTLVVSALVPFLIARSISLPLRQLMEGTRAIAEGKTFYRLDTSRSDELGQIAKDFNTLTERLPE